MIIEHYVAFRTKLKSDELNQENWDILRTESTEMAYAIEDSVEQYECNCMELTDYEMSARNIADILKKYNCKHAIGLGSGKGVLEWHLKRLIPELYVECTDFAAASVDKLKSVFTKCNGFRCFDMMNGDYTSFDGVEDVFFIMYRVSTELSYDDWCKVFGKMHAEGVRNIVFIPAEIATEELALQIEMRHKRYIERGLESTFCGWIYSEDTLEEMFAAGQYRIAEKCQMGDLIMYLLLADGS